MVNSSELGTFNHEVIAAVNGVSILVCLLAAILVLRLKLYRKLVYRLALYQVLSALVMSLVDALQAVFINYGKSPKLYSHICIAIGWMILYAEWMKLLFTMWVTFHLFCFAVLHKNLKLEVLYVVTSLTVPAVVAIIPLVTHSYGLNSDGDVCYIYANTSIAFIERLALWDGPAMFILIIASTTMVVMVIKLTSQVFRRSKYEPITDGDQFWKAVKQLLPLAAFPILFFIFEIPVLIFHINTTQRSTPSEAMLLSGPAVSVSFWSASAGTTVLIHISVARLCGRKRELLKPVPINVSDSHLKFTQHMASESHANSATRFSLPPASV